MSYFKQKVSEEVFKMKYCLNGEKSVEEVFSGIAEDIASVEKDENLRTKWKDLFYDMMINQKFFPGGRIMANARPNTKMPYYNNCYTIGMEDSISGIYDALKEDAEISSTGGGVGSNVSNIRPKGSPISRGGESSGVISFLKVFNESAKIIHTGGQRRAAHIAILNCGHPEIEDFITCKQGDKDKVLNQFNISVGITDKFMTAVENDLDWDLVFDGKVYKTIKAKYLFDLITKNSFEHNEPGVFYLDTVQRYNNGYYAFVMDRVNPCGEITMPPYSVCDLGSLFLPAFVKRPFTDKAEFDYDGFIQAIIVGIRFLDNVLDRTLYPLDKIKDMSMNWRRIGLGFTGLGDTFAMMGMVYGDDSSKALSNAIGKVLMEHSYMTSAMLAKEKGAFPKCDIPKLLESNFIKEKMPPHIKDVISQYGLRNIGMNTTAPTGTQSLTVGNNCSSGIEPIFALKYDRNIRTGRNGETIKETVYDKAWLEYIEFLGKEPEVIPDFFTTTMGLSVKSGIDIQSIFQYYIDHSISKTINIKPGTSFEEYQDIYKYAYKKGLKGTTSFNPDGSMKGVLEYSDKKEDASRIAPPRPKQVPCDIHTTKVNGHEFTVLIGLVNGLPYEIFATETTDSTNHKHGIIVKKKKGWYDLYDSTGEKLLVENLSEVYDAEYGEVTRMISLILRHREHETPLQFIVEQLLKGKGFTSFNKAVARKLKEYIGHEEKVLTKDVCPDCGANLIYVEGCKQCSISCGWGKCS